MFTLYDYLPIGLIVVLVMAKKLDEVLFQHYAQEILWVLPWMKWMTFEEIISLSKCPRVYARRILMACVYQGLLEFDLNEEVNSDDARFKKRLDEALKRPYGVAELLIYRRSMRLRRKRDKKIKLYTPPPQWSPVGT